MSAPPWVQTRTGVAFHLLAPREEDVNLADIVHGLSRIARFSGATVGDHAYTVAQHSVLCADLIRLWGGDAALEREALLHDAAEAYYGDATSPVQSAVRDMHRITLCAFAAEETARWLATERTAESLAVENAVCAAIERLVARLENKDPLRELKRQVDPVVRRALGLAAEEPKLVRRADRVALAIERKFLMVSCPREWELPELADTRWTELVPLSVELAEWHFKKRLDDVTRAVEAARVVEQLEASGA